MTGEYSQEYGSGCLLKAKIDNVKNLSQLLKCVNFKEQATCFASPSGLKIVVEESKCVQAAVFVGAEVFQEYLLKEELVGFKLDLDVLVECLTVLDSSSPGVASLNVYYRGHGFPLRLVLVEEDSVTDCSVRTLEAGEILHFSLPGEAAASRVIADGAGLRELLGDLDAGSEHVDLLLSPDPPHLRITTRSTAGKCHVSLPRDADMVEEFSATTTAVTRYKYSQIKPALKPLALSAKVALQTDDRGLLCFQFMVRTESNQLCYIEYFCTPVVHQEDDI